MKTCNDAPVGYTDHPPVGEWQPWTGGVCPVHPLCVVEYVMRAQQAGPDEAVQLTWTHDGNDWDIVAYRIVEEYKDTVERVAREVWLQEDDFGWIEVTSSDLDATLFREVLE